MTTYTTIPDGDIDQDSPVTQPLLTALRDNPIAIAEGAAGAPRINLFAINEVVAGDTYRISESGGTTSSQSYVIAAVLNAFFQQGTVRIYFEHYVGGDGLATSTARVLIDGVVISTWSTSGSTPVSRQVDASVLRGSKIEIQHFTSNANINVSRPSVVQNVKLGDDNSSPIWPFNYAGWDVL